MVETIQDLKQTKPVLIIEQKYCIYDKSGMFPFGQAAHSQQLDKSRLNVHYCSVGAVGRELAESHYKACLFAGLNMRSFSAEPTVSEWKFEIGPCEALIACDDLWIARFILHRVAEDLGVTVRFELNDTMLITNVSSIYPMPSRIDSPCSICFSTSEMNRTDGLV